MTTNGYRLSEMACKLKEAGLARVNISLHSSHPDRLCKIIGLKALDEIYLGIKMALLCELKPVKLNMVVMKGFNDEEINEMIAYSSKVGAILQLIEFQPLERGKNEWEMYHYDLKPIEIELEKRAKKIVTREMHKRHQYTLDDNAIIEIVRPINNREFCEYCTRLRVTSDGFLKPCLMKEDNYVNIEAIIRENKGKKSLIEAFKEAVNNREPYWR